MVRGLKSDKTLWYAPVAVPTPCRAPYQHCDIVYFVTL